MIVYQLVNEYKGLSEVEAITLAGSGANGRKDNYSDIEMLNLKKKKKNVTQPIQKN